MLVVVVDDKATFVGVMVLQLDICMVVIHQQLTDINIIVLLLITQADEELG